MAQIKQYKDLNAEQRIRRAKIQLGYSNPFWAYLLMNANTREFTEVELAEVVKGNGCLTICASGDGEIIYYPDFICELSEEELKGVLTHEVFHIAFEHLNRLKVLKDNKDREYWNISADIVVNNALLKDGFQIPKFGILPYNDTFETNEFRVENINKKSVEQIYKEIKRAKPDMKNQKGFDNHKEGENDKKDNKDNGKGKGGESKKSKDWKKVLVEGYSFAETRGDSAGEVGRLVRKLLNPELDWRSKLYKYITNEIPTDFTYSRPSKKSIASGIYLPSVKKEKLEIVVGVDTSGSIGQREYDRIIAELINISKAFDNISMKLLTWDTQIHDTYEFKNGDIESIESTKLRGGGGTDINCLLKEVNENHRNTQVLVVITDGYIGRIREELPRNILWVLTEMGTEDYLNDTGEVVRLAGL